MISYETHTGNITPHFDIDEMFFLDTEAAIPCGLILNELAFNCLEHALPDGRTGGIYMSFDLENDSQYAMTVRDNGIGFPEDSNFRETESLGLQLVCSLNRQPRGTVTLDRSEGTAFQIRLSKKQSPEIFR